MHKFNVVSQYLMTMETCSKTVKWHKRYGHLNLRSLKNLADKEMVRGLPKIKGNSLCVLGLCGWKTALPTIFQQL